MPALPPLGPWKSGSFPRHLSSRPRGFSLSRQTPLAFPAFNAGASAGPPEPVPKPEGTAHSWSETTYAQRAPNSTPRLPFPTEPVPGRPRPLHPCREGWGTHMQSVHTESWSLLPQSPHPLTGLEHQGPEQGTGRLPPRLSLGRKGVSRAAARPPAARRTGLGAQGPWRQRVRPRPLAVQLTWPRVLSPPPLREGHLNKFHEQDRVLAFQGQCQHAGRAAPLKKQISFQVSTFQWKMQTGQLERGTAQETASGGRSVSSAPSRPD